ncbi:carbohydrate ABC transporter permease [Enterococcus casseliflavus]|uniref:carbohydrate ABC transporter permease n=1 Tax=Enterococcus casseliflavus TaxID=37734 RepID=UPI00115E1115|nr:carbohydrate ABC transporter permease [Enterococcus casseliflavus]MBO6348988.1 carbohydrate ABC transporter permease [Enterococcus casseliflavus]MBO6368188.1 carbohydrate ABC transporter permease [Enterococcus casseliflavus]
MKQTFSKDEKIFNTANVIFMVFFLAIIALPLWNIVALSFNDATDAARGGIYFWPREFSLESYYTVFEDSAIFKAFVISVAKTVIGVVLHTALTAMVAYGMSRRNLMGRKIYMNMGILTMFVSGGMIPTFLLFKELGLLNNFWVYIIPVLFSFYDMVILMNFFRSIPFSLEESAMMDGANPFIIFVKIILPLSLPVLATIALFHGVFQWNDYMTANIYVDDRSLYPLQMLLFRIVSENLSPAVATGTNVVRNTTSQSLQLATMVVTTVPVVVIYPFLQKYFIQGMTLGSVKE